jgi:hypothetical protein
MAIVSLHPLGQVTRSHVENPPAPSAANFTQPASQPAYSQNGAPAPVAGFQIPWNQTSERFVESWRSTPDWRRPGPQLSAAAQPTATLMSPSVVTWRHISYADAPERKFNRPKAMPLRPAAQFAERGIMSPKTRFATESPQAETVGCHCWLAQQWAPDTRIAPLASQQWHPSSVQIPNVN